MPQIAIYGWVGEPRRNAYENWHVTPTLLKSISFKKTYFQLKLGYVVKKQSDTSQEFPNHYYN